MKDSKTKRNSRISPYARKGSKSRKQKVVPKAGAKTRSEAETVPCPGQAKVEELPVEVILEIFSWATPGSLLNMSRTTKSWHSLLMSRSSLPLWKTARSNLDGFPDIPDDLNEIQYANLAFGTTCSFCFKTYRNTRIVWEARLRTCGRCLKSRFMSERVLAQNPMRYTLHQHGLITFPSFSVTTRGRCREFTTSYYPIDICNRLQEKYIQTRIKGLWRLRYSEKQFDLEDQAETFALWRESHPDAC
ncbi:hypothetical protein GALMADRAFT_245600 [Galerina marginata CBS 339.88]|uniref:F-box domain-containing protein n=1 Tax=Galerina marginata (strain CBS 339.88) TaxID=685588 RepID=A0A067T4Z9_GALM3|nr:hypothetical protein GALMADRAFT_245600 [Galerina marginata CBS 339.88]